MSGRLRIMLAERGAGGKKHNLPVPGAFKPVEDVSAPGVVDLVKWVRVGLLDGHGIAWGERRRHQWST